MVRVSCRVSASITINADPVWQTPGMPSPEWRIQIGGLHLTTKLTKSVPIQGIALTRKFQNCSNMITHNPTHDDLVHASDSSRNIYKYTIRYYDKYTKQSLTYPKPEGVCPVDQTCSLMLHEVFMLIDHNRK